MRATKPAAKTPDKSAKPAPSRARRNTYRSGPDERGHFGIFGGRYVAETLMPLILELEQAYTTAKRKAAPKAKKVAKKKAAKKKKL